MKKKGRYIFYLGLLASILMTMNACAETERTEGITAEITAAQIEGRRAASRIVGPEWNDTNKLINALIETKAFQSKYIIAGKPECASAFDSSFYSTIRTIKPDLAKKMRVGASSLNQE